MADGYQGIWAGGEYIWFHDAFQLMCAEGNIREFLHVSTEVF